MSNFDPTNFLEIYPQFSDITSAQFNYFWGDVGWYSSGFISSLNPDQQTNANYLVLAHLLQIFQNNSVGRVGNAADGSVSTGLIYSDTNAGAWWNQTIYGATIWSRYFVSKGGFRYYPSAKKRYWVRGTYPYGI